MPAPSSARSGPAGRGRTLHIVQGEHEVSGDPGLMMTTILGSCVAACLRDPIARIGGMNHFLLPGCDDGGVSHEAERSAVHAMELLVNLLLSMGASRRHLDAKLFGGACTMKGLADVGAQNAAFATRFLSRERIPIVGQCLGGRAGRRVQYWPVEGRARRSFMAYETMKEREAPVNASPVSPSSGVLELF